MKKNTIPALFLSGIMAFGPLAAPAAALASESSDLPTPVEAVFEMNRESYKQLLIDEGLDEDVIDALLEGFDEEMAETVTEMNRESYKQLLIDEGLSEDVIDALLEDFDKALAEAEDAENRENAASTGSAAGDCAAAVESGAGASEKAPSKTKAKKSGNSSAKKAESDDAASAKKAKSSKKSSKAKSSASEAPSYERIHYSEDLTTEMFIASIAEQARQVGQENNLYASVMIAQAILESDSGSSALAEAPYSNLFGIKGSFLGQSVTLATLEDDGNGNLRATTAQFRAYSNTWQSMQDYARLLRTYSGGYYSGAWKENASDCKEAARFLQGRYATDSSYAEKIIALIDTYDLTRYDEALDYCISGTIEEDDGTVRDLTMNDYANLAATATSFLGTPYVWGGSSPDGFDCSGLVQYVYREALGIELSRTTYTQQNEGVEVDFDDLQMGDLLFFERDGDAYHVAMYLGDGFYIHAPQEGDVVRIADMEDFAPSFARRVIDTLPADSTAKAAEKMADRSEMKNPFIEEASDDPETLFGNGPVPAELLPHTDFMERFYRFKA